jgi:hypothetical protein
MKKIVIIGGGQSAGKTATVLADRLMEENINNVEIIESVEDLKSGILIDKDNKFPIINPYKDLPEMSGYGQSKPFICKGKHEYTEQGGQWICQCGRNIND